MGVLGSIKGRLQKSVKSARESMQQRRDEKESKRNALTYFSMKDLKNLCYDSGIGQPPAYYTDPITGEKRKNRMDRKQYVNFIVKNGKLDYITAYAERHSIRIPIIRAQVGAPTPDVVVKRENVPSINGSNQTSEDLELSRLIRYIKTDFQAEIQDIPIKNEREFTSHLFLALRREYKGTSMNVRNKSGLIKAGDILIGDKYLLELKCAKTNPASTLDHGLSEIIDYNKMGFSQPIMVILDLNHSPQVDEYMEKYRIRGALPIKLHGRGL